MYIYTHKYEYIRTYICLHLHIHVYTYIHRYVISHVKMPFSQWSKIVKQNDCFSTAH